MSKRSREHAGLVAVDRPRAIRHAHEAPAQPQRGRSGFGAAALVLLLAGSLAGLAWAFQSDTFRVADVHIGEASPPVRQAIEDLVAPGCLEDLPGSVHCPPEALGPNELTLSTTELARQMERLPLVKSASVTARLPNQLRVTVAERQPEAAWLVGTQTFRVADDGVVLDQGSAQGLKVAIGQVAGEAVKPGDKIDVQIIKAAEQLHDRLPADYGITPRRIQYSPTDGLAVIGDQDFIAMFGPPVDLNLKMAELQRIMQLAGDKKSTLGFVDLRYKTPYYRTR
ncbi:MAG TPA: FtsQ-type POTRA domain-containing protein [Chloroflexota bacterium]